jgi:hypothetical protein
VFRVHKLAIQPARERDVAFRLELPDEPTGKRRYERVIEVARAPRRNIPRAVGQQ